ncbi:MAG: ATP-binding protein [Oligoflexus sp.]
MFEETDQPNMREAGYDQSNRILHEMLSELSYHSQTHRLDWMTRFILRLSDVVESSHIFIGQYSPDHDGIMETIVLASHGVVRDNIKFPISHSPIQRILVHREALVIESELTQYFSGDLLIKAWHAQSCVCLPLLGDGKEVIGVLAWFHSKPRQYHSSTLAVLRVLARLATIELRHRPAKLYPSQQNLQLAPQVDGHEVRNSKAWEASLRLRLDAYQDVVQGFAHEIRNPIHLMVNAGKLMEQQLNQLIQSQGVGESLAELLQRNLDLIHNSGQRLDYLVSMLWERLSLRQNQAKYCSVNEILLQQVELLKRQFPKKFQQVQVSINLQLEDDLPYVFLCPEVLGKVISNMLLNSLQAIEEKNLTPGTRENAATSFKIDMQSRFDDRDICIEIIDDGIGLEGQSMFRVFDPFYSTKPPGKGLGLGLSLSYQIVTEDYGGHIEVSRTDDDRTLFRIFLPFQNLSGCHR